MHKPTPIQESFFVGRSPVDNGRAVFSECRTWRYELERRWDHSKMMAAWICMNPSTATETVDDPTVRKIIGFSKRHGYGGFVLFNLLAVRMTDPKGLTKHFNPRGPDNDPFQIARRCKEVSPDPPFIAWGCIHRKFHRDAIELMRAVSVFRTLGRSAEGHPRHPLMLAYSTPVETLDTSRFFDVYRRGAA